jgi:hypothetical protein
MYSPPTSVEQGRYNAVRHFVKNHLPRSSRSQLMSILLCVYILYACTRAHLFYFSFLLHAHEQTSIKIIYIRVYVIVHLHLVAGIIRFRFFFFVSFCHPALKKMDFYRRHYTYRCTNDIALECGDYTIVFVLFFD